MSEPPPEESNIDTDQAPVPTDPAIAEIPPPMDVDALDDRNTDVTYPPEA